MVKVKKKDVKKKTAKKKPTQKKVTKKKAPKAKKKVAKTKKKATKRKTKVKKIKKKVKKKKIVERKVEKKATKSKQTRKKTAIKKRQKIFQKSNEFEEIEQMLLNQRAELLKLISKSSTWEKDISKLEHGDLEDMAATSLEREMTFAMGSREREEFRMINSALKKIAARSYGKCENCGEKIKIERLKIVPFAQFCMECKSIMEQEIETGNEYLFK